MLKLNKCRTLYAFTETALAGIQGQAQQASTQGQETTSSEQPQTSQTDNSKENKKESQKQDSTAAKEQGASQSQTSGKQQGQNKAETQTKGDEQNKDDNSNKEKDLQETAGEKEQKNDQQQQSQYLYFNADEFIITTYQYENGWWYGYLDTGAAEADRKMGFFPSNYVQVIEDYSEQNLAEQQEIENMKANADMNQAFTWDDYAKISYMDDNQILVEERMKRLNDVTAPENRNPDGILGYKKIKIHESRSHAVNPHKGGVVQTSQVAIKDQSQVAKAYRQMNHYFDYDAWIEDRNKNPVQKAKADPSKRKEKKKVLNW